MLSGGMSTGRTVTECVSPDLPTIQFCENAPPFTQTLQFKVAAVYPLPWWGIQAAANLQNLKGIPHPGVLRGDQRPDRAVARPRPSGVRGTGCLHCHRDGQSRSSRTRCSKTGSRRWTSGSPRSSSSGGSRLQGMFDIYNLFNAATRSSSTRGYGPSWLVPAERAGGPAVQAGSAARLLERNRATPPA